MSSHYILDANRMPVNEPDLLTWARWFESADRIVKQERIGEYFVSTVFLGLDHSFGGDAPMLFETMVFPDQSAEEQDCERCSTWEEALVQHERLASPLRERSA